MTKLQGHVDLSLAQYHAHPALSRSKLWWANESPANFKYFLEHPPMQSPDMIFGAAFHKLVLEPESFDAEYVTIPYGITRYTAQGKTICQAAREAGKTALLYAEREKIEGMKAALLRNPKAAFFLERGFREYSIFWEDPETKEQLKCRPDLLIADEDLHLVIDLKSCASADTDRFTRDALSYGYLMQTAMYIEGVKTVFPGDYSFLFLAVEKTPPYAVNIIQADQACIDYGRIQFHDLLETVHKCRKSGKWFGKNGEENNINTMYLPAWVQ